jgi:PAS domain S-box-containing protein
MFRALLEAAPDAMVIVGDDGRMLIVNRRAEEIFGYPREELVGRSVEILVPERSRRTHPFHRAKFFTDPKVRPMGAGLELFGRRKDGSEFPVDISLAPLETDDGVLVSAAIRDISERKRAEEQTHRLEQMELRRRQALELNDEIVQGLTVALMAHSLGRYEEAEDAIESTLAAAKTIIGQMLSEELEESPPDGGGLRRDRAALSRRPG